MNIDHTFHCTKPCCGRHCIQNQLYQELHEADEINDIIIDYLENAGIGLAGINFIVWHVKKDAIFTGCQSAQYAQ